MSIAFKHNGNAKSKKKKCTAPNLRVKQMPELSFLKYSACKYNGCVLYSIQPPCLFIWLRIIIMLVWIFSRTLSNNNKKILFFLYRGLLRTVVSMETPRNSNFIPTFQNQCESFSSRLFFFNKLLYSN